jgi:hypothetical protein
MVYDSTSSWIERKVSFYKIRPPRTILRGAAFASGLQLGTPVGYLLVVPKVVGSENA